MKRLRKLLPILFLLAIIFTVSVSDKKVDVLVTYDSEADVNPEGTATLYYSDGSGFLEEKSDYETIQDYSVDFSFRTFLPVKQLRIQPTRKEGQAVYLKKVDFFVNNEMICSLSAKDIYGAIDLEQESAEVKLADAQLIVDYYKSNAWCYIDFLPSFVENLNKYTVREGINSICIILILLVPLGIMYLNPYMMKNNLYKKIHKYGSGIGFFVCLLLLWFLQNWLSLPGILLLWLCPFVFWNNFRENKVHKMRYVTDYLAVAFCAMILVYSKDILWSMTGEYTWKVDYIFLVLCAWMGSIALWDLLELRRESTDNNSNKWLFMDYRRLITPFVVVCITFLLYEYVKYGIINSGWYGTAAAERLLTRFLQPEYLMNVLWGVLFLWTLLSLLGKGIGYILYGILYLTLLIGNIVKITFHNTLLTPLDFVQLSEAFKIAETMLGTAVFYLILCVLAISLIVLFVLAVIFRKKWIPYFKFSPSWVCFVSCLTVCVCLTVNVVREVYFDRNIFYKGYVNEFANEQCDGFAFYNLINLSKINEIFMSEPEEYSEEYVEAIKQDFPVNEKKSMGSTSPNVILIMAESLFDIENIPEVTFNQKIEPTLREYKKGTLISPRYGGYTSAVEYEALTGLSLAYYPSAMVPYTTYFNATDNMIPSIVSEFNKNGYLTYAIHPNDKTFYNRDKAYEIMGFDTFLDQSAFTFNEDNVVAGVYLKDQPIADKIKALIDENEEPVFTFAVTIAGHYMNEKRYETTDIEASCDLLSESELDDIVQAATAFQETDQMFGDLVEYIKQSEEPTLLYIFGDHLPPFPAFEKLNYIQDINQKYATCLSAYSNYTEIEFPEYITPNQIAAQIMHDSGIGHSGYYDYIYALREQYPVIHKEFCSVEDNTDLEIYRTIQYDIMFGNQYFYEPQVK